MHADDKNKGRRDEGDANFRFLLTVSDEINNTAHLWWFLQKSSVDRPAEVCSSSEAAPAGL